MSLCSPSFDHVYLMLHVIMTPSDGPLDLRVPSTSGLSASHSHRTLTPSTSREPRERSPRPGRPVTPTGPTAVDKHLYQNEINRNYESMSEFQTVCCFHNCFRVLLLSFSILLLGSATINFFVSYAMGAGITMLFTYTKSLLPW